MRPGEWPKRPLRELLEETDDFITVAELVTSRGLMTGRNGRKVLHLARQLSSHPQVHALSITDNPGGNAMIGADAFGTDLISRGQEVIIHLSCKDWNRNALQSRGWQLSSEGFNNILALSGDFPTDGYQGLAGAVFDIDSVALLRMYSDMNAGLELSLPNGETRKMEGTQFFLGAVVNNHKRYEREVMPQYFKLAKKIECGARFVITQIGYDSRKHDELLKYMDLYKLRVPMLANVFVLSLPVARYFHADKIPGCVVTDELLAMIEKQAQSPDKGKAFLLEFAAKQCAIAKGLGFRGVYLGGHWNYEDFEKLLEIVKQFGESDWKLFAKEIQFHQPDEFYYFEPDPETGLSSTDINRAYLQSKTPESLGEPAAAGPLELQDEPLDT
ncbi:MAG: methylenetetrahydrofolate reductase [Terriglobia bacterium]